MPPNQFYILRESGTKSCKTLYLIINISPYKRYVQIQAALTPVCSGTQIRLSETTEWQEWGVHWCSWGAPVRSRFQCFLRGLRILDSLMENWGEFESKPIQFLKQFGDFQVEEKNNG